MAGYLSAGVFPREIDQSLCVSNLSKTTLGMVGLATKGLINVPTFVTDAADFAIKFGGPVNPALESFFAPYAALQYLHIGTALWFTRVAELDPNDTDGTLTGSIYAAKYAKAVLTETSTPATIICTKSTLIALSTSNNVLSFIVDGVLPGFSVEFSASTPVTLTVADVVTLLNANATFAAYMVASVSAIGSLTIKRTALGSDHSLQISGIALSGNTGANVFGFPLIAQGVYTTAVAVGTGKITENAFILGSNVGSSVVIGTTNNTLSFWTGVAKTSAVLVSFVIPSATYSSIDNLVLAINAISVFSTNLVATAFSDASGVGQVKISLLSSSLNKYLAAASLVSGTLTSTGVTPSNNDTVTIGSTVYTFKTSLTPAAYEVLIGGSAANALINLKKAINASGVANTDYGTGTLIHPTVYAGAISSSTLVVTAKTALLSETSIATSNVGANLTWGVAALNGDAAAAVFGTIGKQAAVISNIVAPYAVIATGVNDTLIFSLESGSTTTTSTVTIPAATYGSVSALVTALNNLSPANLVFSSVTLATAYGSAAYLKVVTDLAGLILTGGTALLTVFGTRPIQKRASTATTDTLDIQALSQGTWGNSLRIEIANLDTVLGNFDVIVYSGPVRVEAWRKLNKTSSDPRYVETIINDETKGSKYITVVNPSSSTELPVATGLNPRTALVGGTNGATTSINANSSLYIGYDNGVTVTGLQNFRNPETYNISILAVPGISDASVINEMIDICSTRADCIALVDPPAGYTPSQVVDWVNGQGAYNDHAAFNSSYAAVYWPWLQINDPINNVKIYTPPSGFMAGVFSATDDKFDPWIAPAGLTRGKLNTPIKAQYVPKKGDLDLLYSNNINPIATFKTDGINVWGQKTLQRATTALDRVNVRRLMIFVETLVASTTRRLVFEPDDPTTWLTFVNMTEPFLQAIKDRRGISEFKVICDSSTNKANELNNSEMRALVFIKPVKAAEFIQVDFILTEQGANFSELTF